MPISQQIGASSLLKPGVVDSASARPATPYEGQVIFQKDTDQLLVWNGTAWVIPNSPTQNPMGLELVKTQTVGSGVSSVTVTDCFNSNYDNYLIKMSGGIQSASTDVALTIGGSATGYYGFLIYGNTGAVQGASQANNTTFPWVGGGTAGQACHVHFDLIDPFLSAYTKIRNGMYQNDNNYGTMQGEHRVSSSYTYFTLIIGTGTMTGGTIRVYGYRK